MKCPNNNSRLWAVAVCATLNAGPLPCGAASASAAPASETLLENASARVVVRDNRLVSLQDKARSIEHVVPDPRRTTGLFHVQWVKGIQPAGELDATEMTSRVAHRSANEVELEFEHPQASARVRITLAKTPGEIECFISVAPRGGGLSVGRVDFPVIRTPEGKNSVCSPTGRDD